VVGRDGGDGESAQRPEGPSQVSVPNHDPTSSLIGRVMAALVMLGLFIKYRTSAEKPAAFARPLFL